MNLSLNRNASSKITNAQREGAGSWAGSAEHSHAPMHCVTTQGCASRKEDTTGPWMQTLLLLCATRTFKIIITTSHAETLCHSKLLKITMTYHYDCLFIQIASLVSGHFARNSRRQIYYLFYPYFSCGFHRRMEILHTGTLDRNNSQTQSRFINMFTRWTLLLVK